MTDVDVNLGDEMNILERLNPFRKSIDNITGTIDKFVDQKTLDVDLANELKTAVQLALIDADKVDLELRSKELEHRSSVLMAKEESHRIALQTKTTPTIDAIHKLARPFLVLLSLIIPPLTMILLSWLEVDITAPIAAILGISNLPGGTYIYKKGKGYPYRQAIVDAANKAKQKVLPEIY